ncbi:ScbA/BarX family gamma-butyrolactone biosynthesis protein [Streptomyces sp. NPDC052012]|uniref:ScbA/BarX family gamma-butyrolactone biosynthesis protein n=1 Tax=Streptomyces sp. NPDC052012 TaxID=3155051 RepID=UPI003450D018
MPKKGPSSAPREDQTGQQGAAANATGGSGARTRVTTELAHRPRASDVFPAEWVRLTGTRFRVTAHWPDDHSFFGAVDDRHQDPMIVGETLRQTSMALAHAEFGAPADTHFVMWDLEVATDPSALRRADAAEPVTIDVVCSEIRRRGRGLSSMRTTMEFHRAGRLVARGTGSTGCTSPAAYRRLRARQLAAQHAPVPLLPPVSPELVGRTRAEDVVLAPADSPEAHPDGTDADRSHHPATWLLRANTAHPVLFARPNDHVPGMVLFEAARQAATAASGRRPFLPYDMSASFSRYAELHSPCRIEAEVLEKGEDEMTVRVYGHQDGETVFTAVLAAASPAPPLRSLP